jgi:hypothetical protein
MILRGPFNASPAAFLTLRCQSISIVVTFFVGIGGGISTPRFFRGP